MSKYRPTLQTSTASILGWHEAKVAPAIQASPGKVEAITQRAMVCIGEAKGKQRDARLHVLNAVLHLAKTRSSDWVQVSVAYVMRGADVSEHTARSALDAVAKALKCTRTNMGFLTTTKTARLACWNALLWLRGEGIRPPTPKGLHEHAVEVFSIDTPKNRGATR